MVIRYLEVSYVILIKSGVLYQDMFNDQDMVGNQEIHSKKELWIRPRYIKKQGDHDDAWEITAV